ncbi:MAG: methylated-DNA--[protein]-cysteine S-methyltransferase [Candidatus Berkiella sp.]
MFDLILETPIGNLGIACEGEKLKTIRYLEQKIVPLPNTKQSMSLRKIAKELDAFFVHPTCLKNIAIFLSGTPFQKKVWQALRQIPLGQTCTYGELALKLNTSARAVGMACRANPIALVVPCHRVVAANDIGGFCGQTKGNKIAIKQWLLAHEKAG